MKILVLFKSHGGNSKKLISSKKYCSAFVFFLISFVTFSQTPMFMNSSTAGGGNSIPFNPNISTIFQRAQFAWAPASFSGSFSGLITKVYFNSTSATSTTFSNFILLLGTSTTNPINSTAWYSTGMLTCLNSSAYSVTTLTNGWFEITLTTPFYFDNSKYLIIDVSSSGTSSGGFAVNQPTSSLTPPGRVYGAQTGTPSGADALSPNFGFDMTVGGPGGPGAILPPIANFFPSQSTRNTIPTDTVWINSPYNLVSTSTNASRTYWDLD
ncbi:MAG: hypothetical protein H7296_12110, partial [Bacteroidia bacterium]|nr:hypothetical protein [Bacteroidia bacterium]